jgi:anti-anti-sigma regulatory factor
MNVKIDTKEKFVVITPQDAIITANMTADIENLIQYGTKPIPNIIFNMSNVVEIDAAAAEKLVEVQQNFYGDFHSFVICEMQPNVETFFQNEGLDELMNTTPTESEAWDIVQMEEIERELMGDDWE